MSIKAGETYLICTAFHDPTTGDEKDPTSPAAKYRTPSGTWTATSTPTKQDSQDGFYGVAVDTTGFAVGDYAYEIHGTVATDVVQRATGHFTVRTWSIDDLPAEVWKILTSGMSVVGSIGKKLADWVIGNPMQTGEKVQLHGTQPDYAPAKVSDIPTASQNAAEILVTPANKLATDGSGNVTLKNGTHTGAVIPTVTTVTNDVGITQAGADKAWNTSTRTITDRTGFSLSTAGVNAIADQVWDEQINPASHGTTGSAGRRLYNVSTGTVTPATDETVPSNLNDMVRETRDTARILLRRTGSKK